MNRRRARPVLPRDRHFDPATARSDGVSLPALGRDVPWKIGPEGYPVADLPYRVVDYSYLGDQIHPADRIRHETMCPHCGKWLSYRSRDEAAAIYLNCEDHKPWENGPFSRS